MNPFQAHAVTVTFDLGFPRAPQDPFPLETKSGLGQGLRIGGDGGFQPLLRILENIDIVGKARSLAIDSDAACYVAIGASLGSKQTEDM